MRRVDKFATTALTALLLGTLCTVACTPPIYHHAYVTKYDADGRVIGYEETESITQQDPNASTMKVRIDHRDKIER